jgi:hypothetical protein
VADHQPFPPGARRGQRPAVVSACPSCGELAGRGYPDCGFCAELLDQFWLADWEELRRSSQLADRELAELVTSADVGVYPWTCVDWAMTLLACSRCGAELGTGPVECVRCAVTEERRWRWDHVAHPNTMNANEHLLRVARSVMRAPHRKRQAVVQAWRLVLPFLIAGEVVDFGRLDRIRAHVLAGGYASLAACHTLAELAGLPELFWRRGIPASTRVEYQPDSERQQHAARQLLQSRAHPRPAEPAADGVQDHDDDQVPEGVDHDPEQREEEQNPLAGLPGRHELR